MGKITIDDYLIWRPLQILQGGTSSYHDVGIWDENCGVNFICTG
jgi:hypothetical protein